MGKDKQRILQNRAKKLARMASQKKKRKHAASEQGRNRFADLGCTRSELGRRPIHAAYVGSSTFSGGIGQAILARTLPNGLIASGVFLIDAYCMGVKNAFFVVQTPSEFQETLDTHFAETGLQPVSPAYLRKLLEDAIAYARNLGFEPHRDYREAEIVLGDVDTSACTETFTFGKDGKPFYISGPNESEAQSRRIVEKLMNRCGKDGAHYVVRVLGPNSADDVLDEDADEDADEDTDE